MRTPQLPRTISDLIRTFEDRFRVGKAGGGAKSFELFNGFLGRLIWTPTANRDIIIPDSSGTIVLQNNGRITELAFPQRAGLFITPASTPYTPTTRSQASNVLRAWPMRLNGYRNFAGIRSEVTTLGAGATYRTSIYSDNGSSYPGSLLANSDTGAFDASTVGLKSALSVITATTEWVWVAVNFSVAATMRAIPVSAGEPLLGVQGNGGTNHCFTGWSISQPFGPMPATFPSGATLLANTGSPWVALTTA